MLFHKCFPTADVCHNRQPAWDPTHPMCTGLQEFTVTHWLLRPFRFLTWRGWLPFGSQWEHSKDAHHSLSGYCLPSVLHTPAQKATVPEGSIFQLSFCQAQILNSKVEKLANRETLLPPKSNRATKNLQPDHILYPIAFSIINGECVVVTREPTTASLYLAAIVVHIGPPAICIDSPPNAWQQRTF